MQESDFVELDGDQRRNHRCKIRIERADKSSLRLCVNTKTRWYLGYPVYFSVNLHQTENVVLIKRSTEDNERAFKMTDFSHGYLYGIEFIEQLLERGFKVGINYIGTWRGYGVTFDTIKFEPERPHARAARQMRSFSRDGDPPPQRRDQIPNVHEGFSDHF